MKAIAEWSRFVGELMASALSRNELKVGTGWLAYHEEAYQAWKRVVQGEHFEGNAPCIEVT
ncbi:MAG: hypothetical protein IJ234_08800 [Clostridia bacterium]|nr:hypothetical protein [Clostridia bacterium]